MPPHQRVVLAGDLSRRERCDERVVRRLATGDHHQTARVAIEPVHDPGPVRRADTGDPLEFRTGLPAELNEVLEALRT